MWEVRDSDNSLIAICSREVDAQAFKDAEKVDKKTYKIIEKSGLQSTSNVVR